jgi:hypothetical protein
LADHLRNRMHFAQRAHAPRDCEFCRGRWMNESEQQLARPQVPVSKAFPEINLPRHPDNIDAHSWNCSRIIHVRRESSIGPKYLVTCRVSAGKFLRTTRRARKHVEAGIATC